MPIWAVARTARPRPPGQSSDVFATQEDVAVRMSATASTVEWTLVGGPGERIVFEPYSGEPFEWISRHGIFEAGRIGSGKYDGHFDCC
jgi:hypothetical protein